MKRLIVAVLLTVTVAHPARVDAWYSYQQCTKYEPALAAYRPAMGWDVNRMSYFMWRESRCLPWVVSSTNDHGLLQVNRVNFPYLSQRFGVPTWQMASWLKNPTNNIRAAAALSRFAHIAWGDRYRPWRIW